MKKINDQVEYQLTEFFKHIKELIVRYIHFIKYILELNKMFPVANLEVLESGGRESGDSNVFGSLRQLSALG